MLLRGCGKASLFLSHLLVILAIALGISLSSLRATAQSRPPARPLPPAQSAPDPEDEQAIPEDEQSMPEGAPAPDEEQAGAEEAPSVPQELTLQPGTVITVRINEWLSSDQNRAGDDFSAVLEQPLVADGWVVAYPGQPVTGRVAIAERAGRSQGVSQLGVELSELTLADGQVVPLMTRLVQTSAGPSPGADVAAVAGTTAAGAAIGGIAGGGKGAGIGAGIGAAAGLIAVLATRGRETVIPAESLLTFRVESPVTFSTERSQTAFQPVRPETYQAGPRGPVERRQQYSAPPNRGYYPPPVVYRSYPPPYYYPYVYPYDGYSYRPYGYYSYYSGPSIVFRFRGSHRHSHSGHHYRY